jgi:hypothetical protein
MDSSSLESSGREAILEAGRKAFTTSSDVPNALDMFEQPRRPARSAESMVEVAPHVVGFTEMMEKFVGNGSDRTGSKSVTEASSSSSC